MRFEKRVALVCDAIPEGRVASYGQIARLCGCPRAARQVGRALHRGVSPAAHRVVSRSGALTGAEAFLIGGLQRRLLEAEGVRLLPDGRVPMDRFGWQPSEQELEALEAAVCLAGV